LSNSALVLLYHLTDTYTYTGHKQIMQNKANFQITKMVLTTYIERGYGNLSAKSVVKNKAKQSQFTGLTFYPNTPFYHCFMPSKSESRVSDGICKFWGILI